MAPNDSHPTSSPPPPDEQIPTDSTALSWVQLLLDPRGIQTLMATGGGLLSLGLVIWLAVVGVFKDPVIAASGLGLANLGLLAAGVAIATRTRHQLAGRATAMLACLLLPLNLWFYDAQGLITLDGGGHLWLPALVCCVIYAGIARLLKDSLFVYAFVGGVALSGLLFLAGGQVERLWEVLAPSTLLVALGVACLHAERLFPAQARDEAYAAFTRGDFGRAFFRAGHALLATGLVVLLGGRVAGRLYGAVFADLGWFTAPDVATVTRVKLAALGLALAGVYAYAYSRLTVGGKRYSLFAALSLAWSALIGFDLMGIEFTETIGVGLLAVVAIACRLFEPTLRGEGDEAHELLGLTQGLARFTGGAAVVLTTVQLLRGLWMPGVEIVGFSLDFGYLVATSLAATAQGLAIKQSDRTKPNHLVGLGLTTLAASAGLSYITAPPESFALAWRFALLACTPVAWAFLTFPSRTGAFARAAETTALVVLAGLAPYAFFQPALGTIAATGLLAFAFGVVSMQANRPYAAIIAALLLVASGAQAMVVYQVGLHLSLLTLSTLGTTAVVASRLLPSRLEQAAFPGRIAVILGATAGGLLVSNRLLAHEMEAPLLGLLVVQTVLGGVAAWLTRPHEGRRGMIALTVGQLILVGLGVNELSVLSLVQRVELLGTAIGVGMLVVGHLGWRREANHAEGQRGRESFVDANLWVGSLMATAPAAIGLLVIRAGGGEPWWTMLHEVGVLALGLALIGSGFLCRLKATTLTGIVTLTVYLLSLITLINVPDQLQNVAVYLMAGGGALFAGAVLLSVYRDRLLTLPDRIREGEGVFAVLNWR
ncbi:hypothetical protein MalM25_03440 [Planctomycetes bacterium MalM25]|nr:hypothetical protein MalM25_03440 [Planctomycetes bacterium MalM25]